jgi:hypothetical protein
MKLVYAVRLAVIIVGLFGSSCSQDPFASKRSVERAHGLKLPASARNLQHRKWGNFLDKTVFSLFEIDKKDLPAFIGQLKIKARDLPGKQGSADPRDNSWNVWPPGAVKHLRLDLSFAGLSRTWSGEAVPSEILICASPKGVTGFM